MFKCLNASILKYITLVFRWKDLTFPVQISHSSQVRFKSGSLKIIIRGAAENEILVSRFQSEDWYVRFSLWDQNLCSNA